MTSQSALYAICQAAGWYAPASAAGGTALIELENFSLSMQCPADSVLKLSVSLGSLPSDPDQADEKIRESLSLYVQSGCFDVARVLLEDGELKLCHFLNTDNLQTEQILKAAGAFLDCADFMTEGLNRETAYAMPWMTMGVMP